MDALERQLMERRKEIILTYKSPSCHFTNDDQCKDLAEKLTASLNREPLIKFYEDVYIEIMQRRVDELGYWRNNSLTVFFRGIESNERYVLNIDDLQSILGHEKK